MIGKECTAAETFPYYTSYAFVGVYRIARKLQFTVRDRRHPCPAARTYRRRRREAYGVHIDGRLKCFGHTGMLFPALSLAEESHYSTKERNAITSTVLGRGPRRQGPGLCKLFQPSWRMAVSCCHVCSTIRVMTIPTKHHPITLSAFTSPRWLV